MSTHPSKKGPFPLLLPLELPPTREVLGCGSFFCSIKNRKEKAKEPKNRLVGRGKVKKEQVDLSRSPVLTTFPHKKVGGEGFLRCWSTTVQRLFFYAGCKRHKFNISGGKARPTTKSAPLNSLRFCFPYTGKIATKILEIRNSTSFTQKSSGNYLDVLSFSTFWQLLTHVGGSQTHLAPESAGWVSKHEYCHAIVSRKLKIADSVVS